jgi:asparagine synthase (glutamine-hydrolysing)
MCGIAGFIGQQNKFPRKSIIQNCLKLMKKRGPDDQSSLEFKKKFKYLFCASRLSIIDLNKRSNQPFEDENGVLIFNGEIYNYIEVKKKLKKKNIKFSTDSDTEVLLKFLHHEGEDKIEELDGMWSFAYYSKKRKITVLSRDKFGEKPLYYNLSKKDNYLIFGSNVNYIKELSKKKFHIDEEKIINFIKNSYRSVFSSEGTFFRDINYLEPGTNLIIDENLNIKFKKYWNKSKYKVKVDKLSIATSKLKKLIKSEFKKSFRSDTPIAFLLSGGVDSSIISSISSKTKKDIKFYSFKSKSKKYDESKNINILKKKFNLKHQYILSNKKQNFKMLDNFIGDSGFPLMSSTYLAYGSLCKKINKDKYKVLVSGNGGDEIFSGYYAHHMSYLLSIEKENNFKKKYLEWEKNTKPFIRMSILKNFKEYKKMAKGKNPTFHESSEYLKFFKKEIRSKNLKNKNYSQDQFINHLDRDLFEDSIPAQLHSIDNISMYYSIESRAPYLSKNLFDLRNETNKNLLIQNGISKYILRNAFKKEIPNSIMYEKEKIGFYSPLNETINLKNKKITNLILNNSITKKYLNKDLIKSKIDNNNLSHQDEKFIFGILNIALFLKKYN